MSGSIALGSSLGSGSGRKSRTRDVTFPIIGIFFEPIEPQLVPPAIRIRLYTDISAPDWADRVKAGVQGRQPAGTSETLAPFIVAKHIRPNGEIVIEVRPRAGRWRPTVAAVPTADRDKLGAIVVGSPGIIPTTPSSFMANEGGHLYVVLTQTAADPYESAFVFLKGLPAELTFGSPTEGYTLSRASLQVIGSLRPDSIQWGRPVPT
jgi:hypothetical protein